MHLLGPARSATCRRLKAKTRYNENSPLNFVFLQNAGKHNVPKTEIHTDHLEYFFVFKQMAICYTSLCKGPVPLRLMRTFTSVH